MAANSAPTSIPVGEVAESRGVRDCLQWFTREKKWINEIQLQICRVPAPTFVEQERAEWMRAQFRELGCEAATDRAGNVIATLTPGLRGPFVALTAHLDTVLAPRNKDEISLEPDGRLRGPGVADNGAGLAALLAIARALKASPQIAGFHSDLVFVANVGEEGEGNLSGMRYLCQQGPLSGRFGAFLVLDGANTDHITARALGSRRYEVTFSGPGGHSWSDYGIGNPVHALSRAVSLFSDARPNGTAKYSLNVGLIEGGAGINAIPSAARAKVDIRSESEDRLDELVEILNISIARAQEVENQRASGGKVAAKIREIGSRPAGMLPENASILTFLRAVDAHLGIRSRLDCSSTDANIPLFLGIPAVSIGAGGFGGGAHTPQEWFKPEGRDLGLKRILLTLVLLMRDADLLPPGDLR
ncbi:MAG TPA: M20/M25/M40 family metallo-hydrolase [Bryobacteraceae bacterium]|nr:M20/M25/M40 family metallo-hydrolase [Bryobacteraceae bacterium]